MRSIACAADAARAAPSRVVWLPGAFQRLEEFLEAGFDEAVRRRGLALDLELIDLEPRHVTDRAVLESLESVLRTARRCGVRRLWLAGISLGGYLALEYAASRPADWDGLCLLAPFLGSRGFIGELSTPPPALPRSPAPPPRPAAPRPARVAPLPARVAPRPAGAAADRLDARPARLAPGAEERRIWNFVHGGGLAGRHCFLGYGEQDRYAPAHALLARALPRAAVHCVPGGHDWATWRTLWDRFLETEIG